MRRSHEESPNSHVVTAGGDDHDDSASGHQTNDVDHDPAAPICI